MKKFVLLLVILLASATVTVAQNFQWDPYAELEAHVAINNGEVGPGIALSVFRGHMAGGLDVFMGEHEKLFGYLRGGVRFMSPLIGGGLYIVISKEEEFRPGWGCELLYNVWNSCGIKLAYIGTGQLSTLESEDGLKVTGMRHIVRVGFLVRF